jgi:hypothetical protein
MSKFPDDAIAAGFSKRLVAGNVVTTASLPTTRDGVTASCVQIAASVATWVRFGTAASLTCSTSTDILISPNHPHRFKVAGYGFLGVLNDVTGYLSVTAVEIG